MLVMRVMDVFVIMLQHFVRVHVAVLFGQMQPDAGHLRCEEDFSSRAPVA